MFIYIVTLLSVLQTFLNSQKLSEQHLVFAGEFSKLYHDIQQQMCTYRRNRAPATEYLANCLKLYDSLVVKGPDISNIVVSQFKKNFSNSEISLPAIADKIQKIEIVAEANPKREIMTVKNGMFNNLSDLHNVFQINGDISDRDIENAGGMELKQLKRKLQNERMNFEYARFQQNALDD
ncbi:hypothetical protein EB118_12545 [bacterium]|nr:hypothetical protein [bacterium]